MHVLVPRDSDVPLASRRAEKKEDAPQRQQKLEDTKEQAGDGLRACLDDEGREPTDVDWTALVHSLHLNLTVPWLAHESLSKTRRKALEREVVVFSLSLCSVP